MRPDNPDKLYGTIDEVRVTPRWSKLLTRLELEVEEIAVQNPTLVVRWHEDRTFDMPSPLREALEPKADHRRAPGDHAEGPHARARESARRRQAAAELHVRRPVDHARARGLDELALPVRGRREPSHPWDHAGLRPVPEGCVRDRGQAQRADGDAGLARRREPGRQEVPRAVFGRGRPHRHRCGRTGGRRHRRGVLRDHRVPAG